MEQHFYQKVFLFFGLLIVPLVSSAQPDVNLEKYWRYRERLKNFVVVGTCPGCSQPSQERSYTGEMDWSDATIMQGYYIGMLVTEYKLLIDNDPGNIQCKQTLRELFYAIETINRLDLYAEYYWEEFELGINHNGQPPPYSNLNGFFIRDDAKEDSLYLDQIVNGYSVRRQLASSRFPLNEKYHPKFIDSGYTFGIFQGYGPREESQDQVIQLFTGLALVSKFLDQTIIAKDSTGNTLVFTDGETSLLQEVKNIAERIVSHMQDDGWLIKNPPMPDCVQGVCGDRTCTVGACNGGNAVALSYGIYRAYCFIKGNSGCSSDGVSSANKYLWDAVYRYKPLGDQDYKMLTLAAVGNVWGNVTDNIVLNRCLKDGAEHLPLFSRILHGGISMLPLSYYEDLLNSAPCNGTNHYEGDKKWWGASRLLYGPGTAVGARQLEFNGVDYMLFFNLYAIAFPSYLNGAYKVILPDEICSKSLLKENASENNYRYESASESIEAKKYTIGFDNNDSAEVIFKAGNSIELKDGFTVIPGATFSAEIDPGLKSYSCQIVTPLTYSGKGIPNIKLLAAPNPTSGLTNLYLEGAIYGNYAVLEIYSVNGNKVKSEEIVPSDVITVDLNGIASGTYLIVLRTDRQKASAIIILTDD